MAKLYFSLKQTELSFDKFNKGLLVSVGYAEQPYNKALKGVTFYFHGI